MIDLLDFAKDILNEATIGYKDGNQRIISFLEDNNWFDNRPELSMGKVMLTEEQIELYTDPLLRFLNSDEDKYQILHDMFCDKFPVTSDLLDEFLVSIEVTEETQFYIIDFLLYTLDRDIFLMNDKEITELIQKATDGLIKAHGDILTFFLSWLRTKQTTAYKNDYIMSPRVSWDGQKEAYDFDEYIELLYFLYNDDYIAECDMYSKAAESKNYADTWLYLALHFICSLRTTDLTRIAHPRLPKEPEAVLCEIKSGTFSDVDARHVLMTIIWRLCVLSFTPNKSKEHKAIPAIKFSIPDDCEVHIGTLFALCEAHRLLAGISNEEPLVRRITDYESITKYMGDEIGSLFLESNFRSRSVNKSYLQSIFMFSDDILELKNDGPNVKGYILASLARSHKGSYGEFAKTTAIYLKDFKLSGLTPEFVAMELFERGVLSFIPSMLLKIITDGEYNKLSVRKQTELIHILDMSPAEVEKTVALNERTKKKSASIVNEIFIKGYTKESILEALHRIGSGSAFSKQPECLCILTALNKMCPYNDHQQCLGCQFEISTKSTVFLMVSEYNRLFELYEHSTEPLEKAKYKNIITQTILPSMDEVLTCIKEQYGEETFHTIEKLIKENII